MTIDERASTHVYHQKQMFSKEELSAREQLCIYEEPAYCNAACPLKIDMKSILAVLAKGDFDKAYALYEKNTPFPHLLAEGCEAPCEKPASCVKWARALLLDVWNGRSRLMARLQRRAVDFA